MSGRYLMVALLAVCSLGYWTGFPRDCPKRKRDFGHSSGIEKRFRGCVDRVNHPFYWCREGGEPPRGCPWRILSPSLEVSQRDALHSTKRHNLIHCSRYAKHLPCMASHLNAVKSKANSHQSPAIQQRTLRYCSRISCPILAVF